MRCSTRAGFQGKSRFITNDAGRLRRGHPRPANARDRPYPLPVAWVSDAPAAVLVALVLAAVLFLVEVALPTFGVAGCSALVLTVFAGAGAVANEQDPWWPLLLVAAAACLWAAFLTVLRSPPSGEGAAAGLFALGSIGYGVLARDATTVAVAVVASAALPLAFRPLLEAAGRLALLPAQVGMEALVGRSGEVVRWRAGSGTVRIDGSLWNARSAVPLMPGTDVVVVGYDRMTVNLALPAPIP